MTKKIDEQKKEGTALFYGNLAEELGGVSVREAKRIMGHCLNALKKTLTDGSNSKSVNFRGFGTFSVFITKRLQRFTPITKNPIDSPPKKKIKFKLSKLWLEEMNK